MKETLYSIDACHSIFRRVLKFHLTHDEVFFFLDELESMGYESIIVTDEFTGKSTEYKKGFIFLSSGENNEAK